MLRQICSQNKHFKIEFIFNFTHISTRIPHPPQAEQIHIKKNFKLLLHNETFNRVYSVEIQAKLILNFIYFS